jgi:AcrR family transcriptional regulator
VLPAGDEYDDNEQDHNDRDDPSHLHPAWCGGGLGVGGAWRISHVGVLLGRAAGFAVRQFTRRNVSVKSACLAIDVAYTLLVPKLWNETIEEHRREVREAILESTVALVAERGLLSVTMSQIAEETGIGRATLYKYFSSVEAILLAWHERQITGHLEYLAKVRDQAVDADQRLEAVLEAYALISHESRGHHDTELAAFLHRDSQVARAQHQLRHMIRGLLTEAAEAGEVRDDVAPDELATYCLHALAAAGSLPSKPAVQRLVTVTLAGLHPRA